MFDLKFYNLLAKIQYFQDTLNDYSNSQYKSYGKFYSIESIKEAHLEFMAKYDIEHRILTNIYIYNKSVHAYFSNYSNWHVIRFRKNILANLANIKVEK